jgi:HSP20 family protein
MKNVGNKNIWLPTLFEDLLNQNVVNQERFTVPAVNIIEEENSFKIDLAAPGLKKDNFKIEVDNNKLTVTSEVESKKHIKKDNFTRKEFDFSSFTRTFALTENIDVDGIKASYKNGVLSIVLPKKEEKKEIKKMVEIS